MVVLKEDCIDCCHAECIACTDQLISYFINYRYIYHSSYREIELLVYDPAATESESESAVESSDADHENLRNVSLHTHDWLANVLLTKLARWSAEDKLNTEITSLRLIPADKYNQEYQRLKAKYGPYLVSVSCGYFTCLLRL